jgi:hypothetical protein
MVGEQTFGTVKSQASRALAKLRTSKQLLDGSVIS